MLLNFLSNLLSHVFFLFGYISSNNLFPEPLSKTEEEFYLRKYFAGDKNARDKLIEHNLRLVAHIAKRYSTGKDHIKGTTDIRANKKIKSEVSMNTIIGTDKDGNDMELVDTLDSESKDAIDTIYNKIMSEQVIKFINSKLTKREKYIMCSRYGLNGHIQKTQQQIADELGISRSYVSRIETKVQNKLKKYVKWQE